jgi:hypothetical protein
VCEHIKDDHLAYEGGGGVVSIESVDLLDVGGAEPEQARDYKAARAVYGDSDTGQAPCLVWIGSASPVENEDD